MTQFKTPLAVTDIRNSKWSLDHCLIACPPRAEMAFRNSTKKKRELVRDRVMKDSYRDLVNFKYKKCRHGQHFSV